MAAEAEGERAACQRRAPIVDSPSGWDPYEVWLTRVRSPHQSMKAGAAVTVAPGPSITTQLQTAELDGRCSDPLLNLDLDPSPAAVPSSA